METPNNQTTGAKAAPKRHYDTIGETIDNMKLTFGNAALAEIFTAMVVVGYTAGKIADMKAKLAHLETLCQGQTREFADQSAEQEKFNKKRDKINTIFIKDRSLARILFKSDVHSWVALQLDGETPKAYGNWKLMVSGFYAQLADNADLQAKAPNVGITAEKVAAQQLSMAELDVLKESLRKETADAQAATDARDHAFDELYPLYTEYIKYAKILLPDNQVLEAIGVKVK